MILTGKFSHLDPLVIVVQSVDIVEIPFFLVQRHTLGGGITNCIKIWRELRA